MTRKQIAFGLIGALLIIGGSGASWADQTCMVPNASCDAVANSTTSQIQIGGLGSVSSNNTSPATCDGGTPGNQIGATYVFTFDRAAADLKLVVTNTTQSPYTGSLTGLGFNVTPAVTSLVLVSDNDPNAVWSGAFDKDRSDNVLDIPTGTNLKNIKCDGFGRFFAFSGNNGVDTGFGGGTPNSGIAPGQSVEFHFTVTGDLPNVTACSFTSVASIIPPGDKTSIAVGRFQACAGGGSAWAGPCLPTDLLVDLISDLEVTDVDDGIVRLRWETASEVDNVGFAVLEQGARDGNYRRLNQSLIPAQGSPTSGAVYTYDHVTAVNGKKIKLRLEDWDFNGDNTMHRFITVVPNPKHPAIKLSAPGYDESVSSRGKVTLAWNTVAATSKRVLQISGDPTFPEAGTMSINVGSTNSRSLSRREARIVSDMAAFGDGGVYWRVVGQDASRREVHSDVYVLNVTD